jgi:hypothetical protein
MFDEMKIWLIRLTTPIVLDCDKIPRNGMKQKAIIKFEVDVNYVPENMD